MVILNSLLIAVALAMDAFSVSITGGAQLKKVRFTDAFLVAIYFGFFQGIMALFGWYGGRFFAEVISTVDHWVAIGLLVTIGGKMIWESFGDLEEKKFSMTHNVLLILAIATSIDALGIGLSYALLGKPIFIAALIIGVVTFFFCLAGVFLGKILQKILKNKSEFLGGCILIGISIKIAVDHGVI